ncbi:hypothetical protein [Streptomyces sp. NBC_00094]|uniref:hypothetical protein n=1 Tax=Streptomyces sp. NBC_00094 TaxID=2903620 RepID=UPI0022502FC6|nr:hypothetical protein [Streptomyces sp. NBC_00094]MCX5394203.1 hypothetical protein [Streptomyces sp. NBC_00094]
MHNEIQGTHHYVLTFDLPGEEVATWDGTVTPGTLDTRHDVYVFLRECAVAERPQFANASTVFFALERNTL